LVDVGKMLEVKKYCWLSSQFCCLYSRGVRVRERAGVAATLLSTKA